MKFLIIIFTINSFLYSSLFAQDDKDATINALREEIKSLYQINDELRAEVKSLKSNSTQISKSGEEFRVQLGVLNEMLPSLQSPKTLSGTNVNGRMAYDIGGFSSPNEAFSLSQEFRKLDLKGAFVTRYVNGVRDFGYDFRNNSTRTTSSNSKNDYISSMEAAKSASYNSYNNTTSGVNDLPPAKKSKTLVIEE